MELSLQIAMEALLELEVFQAGFWLPGAGRAVWLYGLGLGFEGLLVGELANVQKNIHTIHTRESTILSPAN